MEHVLGQRLEPRPEPGEREELLRVVAEQVGRRGVHQRLERLEDLVEVVVEAVVRVGVVAAVAGDLLLVRAVVLAQQQVVAVLHRGERRRHQERVEPVLDEVELLDDLGPEQRQGVREGREPEAGPQLLGDRRAADERPPLEHQRLEPGPGEVRAVGQAVVAGADDDRVEGAVGVVLALATPGGAVRAVGAALDPFDFDIRPSSAPGCSGAAAPCGRRRARSGG